MDHTSKHAIIWTNINQKWNSRFCLLKICIFFVTFPMGNKFSVVSVMMEGSREAHLKTICVSQQVTLLPLLFMFTLLYIELWTMTMSYSLCAFFVFLFCSKRIQGVPSAEVFFYPRHQHYHNVVQKHHKSTNWKYTWLGISGKQDGLFSLSFLINCNEFAQFE